jgi:competence protein ComEA
MLRKILVALLAAVTLNAFAAVDANRASQAELETVKGIGPGLSAKILKARETGTFRDWNDLVDRVGGIGSGNAARFSQAGLTVGGSGYDASAPAAAPAKAQKGAGKAAQSTGDAASSKTAVPAADPAADKRARKPATQS